MLRKCWKRKLRWTIKRLFWGSSIATIDNHNQLSFCPNTINEHLPSTLELIHHKVWPENNALRYKTFRACPSSFHQICSRRFQIQCFSFKQSSSSDNLADACNIFLSLYHLSLTNFLQKRHCLVSCTKIPVFSKILGSVFESNPGIPGHPGLSQWPALRAPTYSWRPFWTLSQFWGGFSPIESSPGRRGLQ